jgi:hypothetical protein
MKSDLTTAMLGRINRTGSTGIRISIDLDGSWNIGNKDSELEN